LLPRHSLLTRSTEFGAECGTEEHDKEQRIEFGKITEMQRVSDRILLLSSDAVQAPFTDLTTFRIGVYVGGLPESRNELPKRIRQKAQRGFGAIYQECPGRSWNSFKSLKLKLRKLFSIKGATAKWLEVREESVSRRLRRHSDSEG
jgi:hypothetical protein